MISIIMPVYNGDKFLAAAIESVLHQTYEDFELLIINDGSSDQSESIIADYQKISGGRIKSFRQTNSGVSKARNRGIFEATGEFVAFIDQDDLWIPTKLEKQLGFFNDQSVGMVTCSFNLLDSNLREEFIQIGKNFNKNYLLKKLLICNIIGPPSCVIVKRFFLNYVGNFDETLGGPEDRDMWFRILNICNINVVPEALVKYRMHGNNAHLNIENMMINQKRFIYKHRQQYTWFSKRKANSYIYLDAARELSSVHRRYQAILNAIRSILMYPLLLDREDNKYQILLKALIV